MLATHAVGIDLGTTYSCIAYLNEHGEPVTIPNQEGELCTPSAVLIEHNQAIVGTEALRNAIIQPDRVVQNAKRYLGDPNRVWKIDGREYTPVDIAGLILRKLISSAENQIGKIERAVITVPAQFSDIQRQLTVEAGLKAGLKHVDIINEPVAAALCYVLGTEGLWFSELANEQQILVYDLGGGTFDLSLVRYKQNEVRVIASSGDLHLGGIDWNQALIDATATKFRKEFGEDPRTDPESLQYLSWEVEQTKRSLSVRPRAALSCQHAGKRKTYQIEQEGFCRLTRPLVDRTEEITKRLLQDNKMGWAHVDVVLTTGGASRMPMIRSMLKRLSGRTLNTSLSPDLSIAHGATYYAGMLISNSEFVHSILNETASARLSNFRQFSVNARGLGILVRDTQTNKRVPHYLIPANTVLPAAVTQTFGTVVPNQKRVHLHVVESGDGGTAPYVSLGACIVEDLPPNLPQESEIAVTISYDASARVHVSARDVTSGKQATTEIVRPQNLLQRDGVSSQVVEPEELEISLVGDSSVLSADDLPVAASSETAPAATPSSPPSTAAPGTPATSAAAAPVRSDPAVAAAPARDKLETSEIPIPLCNECGEPLDSRGQCTACGASLKTPQRTASAPSRTPAAPAAGTSRGAPAPSPATKPARKAASPPRPKPIPPASPLKPVNEEEILELPRTKPTPPAANSGSAPPGNRGRRDPGEEEFWSL